MQLGGLGGARRGQVESGGARRCQEDPGGARRSQEEEEEEEEDAKGCQGMPRDAKGRARSKRECDVETLAARILHKLSYRETAKVQPAPDCLAWVYTGLSAQAGQGDR